MSRQVRLIKTDPADTSTRYPLPVASAHLTARCAAPAPVAVMDHLRPASTPPHALGAAPPDEK